MIDRERVIRAWGIFRQSNPYEICEGREFRAISEPEYCMGQMVEDTIAILKELPVWHVFHTRDATDEEKETYGVDIVCECDQYPENGERFLLYEFGYRGLEIQTWDDDQWAEFCSTEDGFQISDGDAWMELPHPPMEG